MKPFLPVLVNLTLLVSLALVTGCVEQRPFPTPPPLPAEILPLPPVSQTQLIWQPGDWTYAGGSYRYEAGRYVPAEGHSRQWMFGHWAPDPSGPVWVPGHWL